MFSAFFAILKPKNQVLKKAILFFLSVNTMLAIYHAGVQYGYIQDFCSFDGNIETLEKFRLALRAKNSCKDLSWSFFGISISAYNALLSMFLILAYAIDAIVHGDAVKGRAVEGELRIKSMDVLFELPKP